MVEQVEMMTVNQIAERFNVTGRAVQKWIVQGYFPNARRIGPGPRAAFRVPLKDVEQFEERLKVGDSD